MQKLRRGDGTLARAKPEKSEGWNKQGRGLEGTCITSGDKGPSKAFFLGKAMADFLGTEPLRIADPGMPRLLLFWKKVAWSNSMDFSGHGHIRMTPCCPPSH